MQQGSCANMSFRCTMHSQAGHKPSVHSSIPSLLAWSQRLKQASTSVLLRSRRASLPRNVETKRISATCSACSGLRVNAVAASTCTCQQECRSIYVQSDLAGLANHAHTTLYAGVEQLTLQPIKRIEGHVKLPGSKSLSNRILLLAALSEGTTEVQNLLVRC